MDETHIERENQLALIEPLKAEDRTSQNHLTPAARDRVLMQIEAQVRKTGNFSINAIKNQLGVRWDTAQQLLKEVAERIIANTEDVRAFELRYLMDAVQNIQDPDNWEDFGVTNKREEIELVMEYYKLIHEILKLKYTPEQVIAGSPTGALNLALFNVLSPKVQEFVRDNYGVDPTSTARPAVTEDVIIDNEMLPTVTTTPEPTETTTSSIVTPIVETEPQ